MREKITEEAKGRGSGYYVLRSTAEYSEYSRLNRDSWALFFLFLSNNPGHGSSVRHSQCQQNITNENYCNRCAHKIQKHNKHQPTHFIIHSLPLQQYATNYKRYSYFYNDESQNPLHQQDKTADPCRVGTRPRTHLHSSGWACLCRSSLSDSVWWSDRVAGCMGISCLSASHRLLHITTYCSHRP